MTVSEFTALTGLHFPLALADLATALERLAKAGYTARVVAEEDRNQNMTGLGLVVEELNPSLSQRDPSQRDP